MSLTLKQVCDEIEAAYMDSRTENFDLSDWEAGRHRAEVATTLKLVDLTQRNLISHARTICTDANNPPSVREVNDVVVGVHFLYLGATAQVEGKLDTKTARLVCLTLYTHPSSKQPDWEIIPEEDLIKGESK